jgi:hypothetical protein
LFSGIRRAISANAASATVTRTGTITVRPGVTEVRVRTARRVPLTITGERRTDIGYELPVESNGPDEPTAKAWAERAELREDDLGGALSLWVFFPEEGTQSAKLVLRVPDHLTVRVEGSAQVQVSGVATVNLFNLAGEASLSGITGAITGSHRTGDLNVTGAGSVNLTLASSRAKFRDVSGGLSLNARNGDCSVARSQGTIDATLANVEFDVADHAGPIKVGGDGGRLKVTLPTGDLSVDARRMGVEATLSAPVATTLITSDEPLRVKIADGASFRIDAATTDGGNITAPDLGVEPTLQAREARLAATVGRGAARVVLRNARGHIVIARAK